MIEYLDGRIAELAPAVAIVDVGGVGYEVNISLATFGELEGKEAAKVFVHEVIREDTHQLFGFATKGERELFRALVGVSGVGAAMARMVLSSISPGELQQVISQGDAKRLKSVKGVGAKTAERIIVDLKDKIKPLGETLLVQPLYSTDVYDEALAALVMLGFPKPASQRALSKLFADEPSLKVEEAIKKAFALL